ncbi:MAG: glutamine-hydrolyzing carbamoyl-phosphate synthase small subunit, partial [Candidatus Omnitrophica bacterium]|nr:glutamine-hydrolyzing carbamoyl-phosphate synthase small subunit [Candidatus Omnitrophota bacterium]
VKFFLKRQKGGSVKAILVLEDGTFFEGVSIGVGGERIGEVILNTAVVGYQEMMTDPSNAGKILVLTYPLIGNYGVAAKFYESNKCWVEALVIKEQSRMYSNWQAEGAFDLFLKKERVVTISEVDTRTLAITIRDKGEMVGIISTENFQKDELLKKIKRYKKEKKKFYIKEISVKRPTEIKVPSSKLKIGVLDLGVLNDFIKQLKLLGCNITLLPYNTSYEKIISMKYDGFIISNGPEQDEAILNIVETVKTLLGKIPILGISTGHEVIGLALGGKLERMKVGHHGANYPVRGPNSYKGEITVQNHSFVVDENSIKNKKGVAITLRNINDNSIERMESKPLKFISVQYYPSSPGFEEVNETFIRFLNMISHNNKRGKHTTQSREVQYAKA